MNFFEVLRFYGNLSENFTSSFLKFLLLPHEKHNLKYYFFQEVLSLIGGDISFANVINKRRSLVIPHGETDLGSGRIEVSIDFRFRDIQKSRESRGLVLIENKIFSSSIQNEDKGGKKQIIRYLDFLERNQEKYQWSRLLYLVPEDLDLRFFEGYYGNDLAKHKFADRLVVVYWRHPAFPLHDHQIYQQYFKKGQSFVSIFEKALQMESRAEIGPLDPNLVYLLKSFIRTVALGFNFDEPEDSFVQRYDDFKANMKASDIGLHAKLGEFEKAVAEMTGRAIHDSMGDRSIKIGIPTPKEYYKKGYKNPQMFVLIKEVHTVGERGCFFVRFEEVYGMSPHWDLDALGAYFEAERINFDRDHDTGVIDVHVFDDFPISKINFGVLKSFRRDRAS